MSPSPTVELWTAGAAAVAAAWLLTPGPRLLRRSRAAADPPVSAPRRLHPGWWAIAAGAAGLLFVPGPAGWVTAALAAAAGWWVSERTEPRAVRKSRAAAAADLPHLVSLLATAVRSGTSPEAAVGAVCAALPGPASDRLAEARARLALGAPPAAVWSGVARDPVLGPLGRCLARAHDTGAPIASEVHRLAEDLGGGVRAGAEDRARTVGVRAAVPLGLCLLPSFLLLGIVPVVGALLTTTLG